MIAAWVQLALALGAGAGEDVRFCETPDDCKKDEVCVEYACLTGSDRARVTRLYKIAVVPPVVTHPTPALRREAEALYKQLIADLEWSGFYEVAGESGLPIGYQREGASAAEMRRSAWQADGFYRAVKIAVGPAEGGKIRVRIQAPEIERFGSLLLPEGDATLAPGQTRELSAAWVNALIGSDTGVPGSVGTRIVGSTELKPGVKEVAVIHADGLGFEQISDNGDLNLMPTFGPRGEIGWMSYAGGNPDWVVDGKPFSTRPGLNAAGAWSPDGKLLALSVAELGDSEIVLLDAATGDEHARLTDHRAVDTSPTWSPDGKMMAFVSDRTNRPQIWMLNLRNGALEPLTKEGYNSSPDWSPLGDSLVYIRQVGGGNFAIVRYDVDSQETRRLTDGRFSAESPTFSPDGRYVAYSVKHEGQARLWIMNADGTNARQVGGERSFFAPDWERRR